MVLRSGDPNLSLGSRSQWIIFPEQYNFFSSFLFREIHPNLRTPG